MSAAHEDEYHDDMIAMLELIWGEGFMTPGGARTVRATVGDLDLEGKLVLDIGCGLGGADLVLAGEFGARVIGLDLEAPLVARARDYAAEAGLADRVEFRRVKPGPIAMVAGSVDVVFTSGAFTQIEDKKGMIAEVHRVLRPGGALVAYDWMKGPEPYSKNMLYWFELEGLTYAMETLEEHVRLLEEAGFVDVEAADDGDDYRRLCHQEYQDMKGPLNEKMLNLLGAEQRDHFLENWRAMTVVLDAGELRPGFYRGSKPA